MVKPACRRAPASPQSAQRRAGRHLVVRRCWLGRTPPPWPRIGARAGAVRCCRRGARTIRRGTTSKCATARWGARPVRAPTPAGRRPTRKDHGCRQRAIAIRLTAKPSRRRASARRRGLNPAATRRPVEPRGEAGHQSRIHIGELDVTNDAQSRSTGHQSHNRPTCTTSAREIDADLIGRRPTCSKGRTVTIVDIDNGGAGWHVCDTRPAVAAVFRKINGAAAHLVHPR